MSMIGMLRAQWDARIRPAPVWKRLAREAEEEQVRADLESDYCTLRELYAIASAFAAYAETIERRADDYMGTSA